MYYLIASNVSLLDKNIVSWLTTRPLFCPFKYSYKHWVVGDAQSGVTKMSKFLRENPNRAPRLTPLELSYYWIHFNATLLKKMASSFNFMLSRVFGEVSLKANISVYFRNWTAPHIIEQHPSCGNGFNSWNSSKLVKRKELFIYSRCH